MMPPLPRSVKLEGRVCPPWISEGGLDALVLFLFLLTCGLRGEGGSWCWRR